MAVALLLMVIDHFGPTPLIHQFPPSLAGGKKTGSIDTSSIYIPSELLSTTKEKDEKIFCNRSWSNAKKITQLRRSFQPSYNKYTYVSINDPADQTQLMCHRPSNWARGLRNRSLTTWRSSFLSCLFTVLWDPTVQLRLCRCVRVESDSIAPLHQFYTSCMRQA